MQRICKYDHGVANSAFIHKVTSVVREETTIGIMTLLIKNERISFQIAQSQILCKHQNRCKTKTKYIAAAAALSDTAYLHNNNDGAKVKCSVSRDSCILFYSAFNVKSENVQGRTRSIAKSGIPNRCIIPTFHRTIFYFGFM